MYTTITIKDFLKNKFFKPEYERIGLLNNVSKLISEDIPGIKPDKFLDVGFGEGDLTKQVASYII